jgi:hypothetical protein
LKCTEHEYFLFKRVILFIFYRNGVDVEGASHKQVVDLIKHSGDELRLVGKNKKILVDLKVLFFL